MILKAVLLFLVAMILLGMAGKWRGPKLPRPGGRDAVEPARKCTVCGSYVLGKNPEPCSRADCPSR